ncbi:polysaccharide export protein [Novosphingobium sp. 1949]|uniref:Polysaccharide export protein n=1 Tax=Novosphingobium organovorum TaxID=2930092 RepID=A0ABT0BHB6_9SPHN|nr:polysaccharide biosynthesis/export family protein [Novosphingobium organovorum]MCJ2184186.1 polysaccharide export protein [Novosphingobium organovorum]
MKLRKFAGLVALVALAGCASLPTNGPTAGALQRSMNPAKEPQTLPIKLVSVQNVGDLPVDPAVAPMVLPQREPAPTDMVGAGDVLSIYVYEAGVALFANAAANPLTGTTDAGVQTSALPPTRVNDNGDITIPYAGKLHVVGHTADEIAVMIRNALRGMSQNPQVYVGLSTDITNSVVLGGELARPGRLALATNDQHLLDVLALAGGYRGAANDLDVRVSRSGRSAQVRMSDLLRDPRLDVRIYPGDRITVISDPLSYSVLGASSKISEQPFAHADETLAEAISNAGGINPSSGDPAALFVFRYTKDAQGQDVPVVYHFNMMKGSSFFLAQRFAMHDGDVLYFGSARANQPAKLFQLISQLFTPLVTVAAVANAVN